VIDRPERRELLQWLALLVATVPTRGLAGHAAHRQVEVRDSTMGVLQVLDGEASAQLAVVVDAILPRTHTPAATEVGVVAFIDRVLHECTPAAGRASFVAGLARLDERCRRDAGAALATLDPVAAQAFVQQVDADCFRAAADAQQPDVQFYRRLKQLALVGYFTSREVMEQVLGVAGPVGAALEPGGETGSGAWL